MIPRIRFFLPQRTFEEISASGMEQVAELELGGAEGSRAGVGNQQVGDLLQQLFGPGAEHFEQALNLGLLLLRQRRQSHARLLLFSGLSYAH
jgi:hypothetical protein